MEGIFLIALTLVDVIWTRMWIGGAQGLRKHWSDPLAAEQRLVQARAIVLRAPPVMRTWAPMDAVGLSAR